MKNKLKILLISAFALIALAMTLASCAPHNHYYETWYRIKDPTCMEEGLNRATCPCGNMEEEILPKLEHTHTILSKKEPTCTESGLEEGKYCSICDILIVPQVEIPSLGHTYDDTTHTCIRCSHKEFYEIKSRSELTAYNSTSNIVVYLDNCIDTSNPAEYWTITLKPQAHYIKLIGTPDVVYNVRIVIEGVRENTVKIDLVDVSLKAITSDPVIDIQAEQSAEIGFYGESCSIFGKDGTKGANGGTVYNPLSTGDKGTDGTAAILSKGNLKIKVAADSVTLQGGNGGNGGNGQDSSTIIPINGGNGGRGGNGAYAISATSIDIYGADGHTASSIKLRGGIGGDGGKGGSVPSSMQWLYDNGKDGDSGYSVSPTSVAATYNN